MFALCKYWMADTNSAARNTVNSSLNVFNCLRWNIKLPPFKNSIKKYRKPYLTWIYVSKKVDPTLKVWLKTIITWSWNEPNNLSKNGFLSPKLHISLSAKTYWTLLLSRTWSLRTTLSANVCSNDSLKVTKKTCLLMLNKEFCFKKTL